MCSEDGQLTRSALGRVGFIGELYDARTENFSSRSIFLSSCPEFFVKLVHVNNTSFEYRFTENISERFDLLNVEADIQVSLLCGLFEAEGCGKFLSEESKSENNISCSLLCKFETVCEKLFASYEEMIHHVDMTALSDPQYTHIVVEINWGANCLLDFRQKCNSESQKKHVRGLLGARVRKLAGLLSVGGGVQVACDESSHSSLSDVTIKVVADVVPEGEMPTTMESFCEFLSRIPTCLNRLNGGKGKPLGYVLVQLNALRKAASVALAVDDVVRAVDESFVVSIVSLFEEIAATRERLQDLLNEMCEHQNYLPRDEVARGKKMVESLRVKECRLKSIIAEDWASVRSGKKTFRELTRKVEKFRNRELNLFEFDEYLDTREWIRRRVDVVKGFLAHGAEYLERGKLFSDELNRSTSSDFIVLLRSAAFEASDSELYRNTCHYFMTLISESAPSKLRYVVVDLDLDDVPRGHGRGVTNATFFASLGASSVKCLHIKGGRVLYGDLYGSYVTEKNAHFARVRPGSEAEPYHHRPANRVTLQLSCPGFRTCACSSDKLRWTCFRCKQLLEFGFDKHLYCSCGRQLCSLYEFRCSHEGHGTSFVPTEERFLDDELSLLRPLSELNILILGQSGVGKSTWINSIVNYLSYESLERARANGVICTIPIRFATYDRETGHRVDVEIGGRMDAEVTEAGESGTRSCTTYSFPWEGSYVRVIDTPGIGDTRGIQQDKENMRNIIDHVSHLKELHGICVLIKANDSRISAIFSYCLKELLIHMHKSIAKNVVFCFTNARNSFYTPGQASVLLEKQLESLNVHRDLSLGHHNRFCLDNEAFLFLCTLNNPRVRHDESLVGSFSQSWDVSTRETLRLFNTIRNFRPHPLRDTVSLFNARNRILFLSRPMAEISKTIQMNLTAIESKKRELDAAERTLLDLSKKLHVYEVRLEPVPLDLPRTVCTTSKCVRYHRIEGLDITDVEYTTHCHGACYLKEVVPKAVNNVLLKDCQAMDDNGDCTVCGCNWRYHMHVIHDQKRVEHLAIDKRVECDILREKSEKEELEEFVRNLETKIKKYEKEQDFIIQASVKFGAFLKENAISVYNDAISDYLKYLIREEENKPYKTDGDEKLLKNLKETLDHYEAEVQLLQDVIDRGAAREGVPSVQEVHALERGLYELELSGADIKRYADASLSASSTACAYRETHLRMPEPANSDGFRSHSRQPNPVSRKKWIFF